ncbi:hypothetical protein F5878DRAFT_714070, partial [Lentinula raphanica]
LRIDPECEAAVATLVQLSLQQHQIDNAIKYFERSAELARTEQELAGVLTYQYATNARSSLRRTKSTWTDNGHRGGLVLVLDRIRSFDHSLIPISGGYTVSDIQVGTSKL